MNQPQATTTEPQEITVRIDIKVKLEGNVANLTTLTEKTKPVLEAARALGSVDAQAIFGRQKFAI